MRPRASRFRSVAAYGSGISRSFLQMQPRINPINFFQRIKAPTILIHGKYDENSPIKNGLEPVVALLRSRKRVELFEGGHVPPPEIILPLLNAWFDETLGPVRRN